jgi:hypothetical protein
MATCPRCRGHLTDSHRCPRSGARIAAETFLFALAGGVVAWLALVALDAGGRLVAFEPLAFLLGALAAGGLARALRR